MGHAFETRMAGPRFPVRIEASSPPEVVINGERWLSFGGCDYLGLSRHPEVLDAARRALDRLPLSTTASRTTTGNTSVHEALEEDLREFLGVDDVLLCPDGYTANLAAMQALAAGATACLTDRRSCVRAVIAERSHASLFAAAMVAGLAVVDGSLSIDAAGAAGGATAYLTDAVFTADGRLAPVTDLLASLDPGSEDVLVLDDCHGFTTLGRMGRGSADHHGVTGDPRVVVTSTLAKGLGVAGGFVAGPAWLVDRARRLASAFVGTTPISPILAAAAREALRIVRTDRDRHARRDAGAARLHAGLRSLGISFAEGPCPIAAFVLDGPQAVGLQTLAQSSRVLLPYIGYPGGPAAQYFRVSVGSEHTAEAIDLLLDLIERALRLG